jgi:hypothetical protein
LAIIDYGKGLEAYTNVTNDLKNSKQEVLEGVINNIDCYQTT